MSQRSAPIAAATATALVSEPPRPSVAMPPGRLVDALEARRSPRPRRALEAVEDAAAVDAGRCAPSRARRRSGSGSASPARSARGCPSPAARWRGARRSPARRRRRRRHIRAGRRAAEASRHQPTSSLVLPAMAETTTATLVAGVELALDMPCHVANALYVGDRGAAEFHDETGTSKGSSEDSVWLVAASTIAARRRTGRKVRREAPRLSTKAAASSWEKA